jgi:hypothetical protein
VHQGGAVGGVGSQVVREGAQQVLVHRSRTASRGSSR